MRNKYPFPQIGEVVICRVESVMRGYIQVLLEDYTGLRNERNAHGMIHISELSNRWVKNINSIISIGQRVALQTLRVNENRGYVDLSLRRVNKVQQSTTMNSWKYATKLEGLLKFFAEQHDLTLDVLYVKAIWPLIESYGDLRTSFEEIKEEGIGELENVEGVDLSPELIKALYELIIENITISKVHLSCEYDVRSQAGNGVSLIKEAFAAAARLRKAKGIVTTFSYIGAPIYRLELEAKNYPSAEKHLTKITEKIESTLGTKGTVELFRDELSHSQ